MAAAGTAARKCEACPYSWHAAFCLGEKMICELIWIFDQWRSKLYWQYAIIQNRGYEWKRRRASELNHLEEEEAEEGSDDRRHKIVRLPHHFAAALHHRWQEAGHGVTPPGSG